MELLELDEIKISARIEEIAAVILSYNGTGWWLQIKLKIGETLEFFSRNKKEIAVMHNSYRWITKKIAETENQ